ncbi:MAG: histidine phosphatase family protein [Actinomycetota bacterium]
MAATILGVRHAPVENPGNLVYARLPGYHLSDAGHRSAGALAEELAERPLSAVYASPLERAQETASTLARPHALPVLTDERLIEWSFWSRWEGIPWMTLRERAPETFAKYLIDPGSLHPEDPLRAVGEGILGWAAEAADLHEAGLVLGISHEAPLAAAWAIGGGRGMQAFPTVQIPHLGAVRLAPDPVEVVDVRDVEAAG